MSKAINSPAKDPVQIAIDISVKLGALLLLLVWCFQIISPFISIIFWAMVISVSLFPLFVGLTKKLGGRKKLASAILTILLLSVLIVPSVIFTDSLVAGIQDFAADIDSDSFVVPPPPDKVADWPVIGGTVYSTWKLASVNLEKVVLEYAPQLKAAGNWILNALMGTGLGMLQLLVSIIIGGIFLVISESGGDTIKKFYNRIVGDRGEEFVKISEITIRNVSKGVLGVAVIQSFLAGLVFLLAGVPYAGLWALLALVFCIIQIGPGLVIIPVIVYIFSVMPTWQAVIWTIVLIFVMLSDNILKPILMGNGAPVPMLVIFLGSIGGFISSGFVGLFLGAIILSLGYKLFLVYINESATTQ